MKPILVAEIGICHNGSLDLAKKMIDNAVLAGCQYVKFQKRDINLVYSKSELDIPRESQWGKTFRDQKAGLEFNYDQYKEIDKYCLEKGIRWFASPWDSNSVQFLAQFKVPFIKIPSALITNKKLLNTIKEIEIPVIISTGMSSEKELNDCIKILGKQIHYILSCTSSYPTKDSDTNLNRIGTLFEKYGKDYKVGFSNHSAGILFIIAAAVCGCEMIEMHITQDRSLPGTDQSSSIELPGMLKIKSYLDALDVAWGSGEIECLPCEEPIKKKLRR